MSIHKASLLLVKIGDGAEPEESFITIGGMKATRISFNRNITEIRDVSGEGWKQLCEGGIASARITGQGIFASTEAGMFLWQQAMEGGAQNYRICFGDGGILEGRWMIAAYERMGGVEGLEGFALTLESAGKLDFTA